MDRTRLRCYMIRMLCVRRFYICQGNWMLRSPLRCVELSVPDGISTVHLCDPTTLVVVMLRCSQYSPCTHHARACGRHYSVGMMNLHIQLPAFHFPIVCHSNRADTCKSILVKYDSPLQTYYSTRKVCIPDGNALYDIMLIISNSMLSIY